jgi:DNA-binding LacI/PurR family transcriptional regulator
MDRIGSGDWSPHSRIPPERELAEQFQVSRITAKHAMLKLVNDGWLYRHRGKGTFVADRAKEARAPFASEPAGSTSAQRGKKMIGFIIPWMEAYYSSQLIAGIEASLNRLSYHFLFKRIASREEESQALQELMDMPVDGIIIVASQGEQHFNDDIVRLVLNKHPVVLVERTMRDIRTNGVYCHTEEIGQLMVGYLGELGATNIGLVTYPRLYTIGVSDRVNGFQRALVQRGMEPLSEQRILSLPTSLLEPSAPREIPAELLDYLRRNEDIDAIATVDALLAQYVGMACAKLNRRQMRIICCDQPLLFPNCVPPVAYIDQSPFEMGTRAAQLIVEAIEQGSEPRKEAIAPRLVELVPRG